MGGLITTPDSNVEALKRLLDEVYNDVDDTGLLLLNEILQNADDARAEHVVITWFKNETSDSRNPLLNRSGLLVYNSGGFTKEHKNSFMSFGDSNKKADDGQVGRFGLGRLALFHRTDALFFCGSDGQELIFDCLSPYQDASGKDYTVKAYRSKNLPATHVDWDQFEDREKRDFSARFECAGLPTEQRAGFAIFLPFRDEADHPVLKKRERGRHLLEKTSQLTGALTMPQLQYVRSVTLQNLNEGRLERDLLIETEGDGLSRPDSKEQRKAPITTRGVVRVSAYEDGSPAASNLAFFQRIRYEETAQTKKLLQEDSWPTVEQDSISEPAKASPHGAVTAIVDDQGAGIDARIAVFLPLHSGGVGPARPALRLNLHGYFFVDSGRRGIHLKDGGVEQSVNSNNIRSKWNQTLLREHVLPHVIPVVCDALNSLPREKYDVKVGLAKQLPEALEGALQAASTDSRKAFKPILDVVTKSEQLVTGPKNDIVVL
jgi:hypothetical protein